MKCTYLLLLGIFFFLACSPQQTQEEEAADKINEGVEKLTEGLNEIAEKTAKDFEGGWEEALGKLEETVEGIQKDGLVKTKPINFRKLRDLLPESASGFTRTKANGESTGVAGFNISKVEARYEKDDQRINLDFVDAGGLGSAMMGLAGWSMLKVDKESDNGFERTTTYKGHKAFEKCNGNRCEFAVIVAKRFLLTLDGRNIDLDDLHDIVDDIGLRKLERMKDVSGE